MNAAAHKKAVAAARKAYKAAFQALHNGGTIEQLEAVREHCLSVQEAAIDAGFAFYRPNANHAAFRVLEWRAP